MIPPSDNSGFLTAQRPQSPFLDYSLESPLDCKEIKPVNPKGNQPWIFTGRTDAEAEAPILCPLDVKNWFIRKDPDAGKDWRQEEKGVTEDKMIGWHHWLNGHDLNKLQEIMKDREAWYAAVHGVVTSWTWLSDWKTAKTALYLDHPFQYQQTRHPLRTLGCYSPFPLSHLYMYSTHWSGGGGNTGWGAPWEPPLLGATSTNQLRNAA